MVKTFREYSIAVGHFAQYPAQGENAVYPAMGLAGEAGEVCDKIKKRWRNSPDGSLSGRNLSVVESLQIVKEMGDVLWYLNALARELGVTLEQVADANIRKLTDRAARNVILSEGDNR